MTEGLDTETIAHWSQEFAQDEQQALRAALDSLGDRGFRLWIISLGFDAAGVVGADESAEGCPWGAHDGSLAELVKQSFGDSFAGTLSSMAERCVAVYRVQNYGHWLQLYVLRDGENYRLYAGGPPNNDPAISDEFRDTQWGIPYLLKTFYRAHDGFGPMDHASSFWFEDAILPSAALAPLTRYVGASEEILFKPNNCLMFYPDGGGNGYCFQRTSLSDGQPGVVFWAWRNQELEEAPSFLTLLKRITTPGQDN